MKKIIILACMLYGSILLAQQTPTGPTINPNAPVPQLAGHAWYRGGNNLGGIGGNKNIFGTMWNSPIYTYTNGINRSRLNGTFTTLLNGVNQNVSGFMGLAPDGYFANNTPITLLY